MLRAVLYGIMFGVSAAIIVGWFSTFLMAFITYVIVGFISIFAAAVIPHYFGRKPTKPPVETKEDNLQRVYRF